MKCYDTIINNDKDLGKRYWKKDQSQLDFVREAYLQVYPGQNKPIFTTKETKSFLGLIKNIHSVISISEETLRKGCWLKDINKGDGLLKRHMLAIIEIVCDYQKLRRARTFTSGFSNDPRNLVCHELKVWCVEHCKGDDHFIEEFCADDGELMKRIKFIDSLVDDPKQHFPQGLLSESTFLETMNDSRIILNTLRVKLTTKLKNQRAREKFKVVCESGLNLIQDCVNFLHYGLRRDEAFETSNIPALVDPNRQPMPLQDAMDCEIGKMLQQLLSTPTISELFSSRSMIEDSIDIKNDLLKTFNRLLNSEYGHSSSEVTKEELEIKKNYIAKLLINFSSKKSGVSEYVNKPEILNEFIDLHLLVNELAQFVLAGKILYDLAGQGGDLVIFGFINKAVEDFLSSYLIFLEQIKRSFESYFSKLDACSNKLIRLGKDKVEWRNNFKSLGILKNVSFDKTVKQCSKHINSVRNLAKESSVEKIYGQINASLYDFIETSSPVCMRWGGFDIAKRFAGNNLLTGVMPRTGLSVEFTEEEVLGDGHCGFTTLGASRNQVVDVLLTLEANQDARARLWEEIYEAFDSNTLQRTTEFKKLYRAYQDPNITKEVREQVRLRIAAYCKREVVFRMYVESYRGKLWLGYKSALLYAKQSNITVYVWKKAADGPNLELMGANVAEQPKQVIHMLLTQGYTHYNLLVETPTPEKNHTNSIQRRKEMAVIQSERADEDEVTLKKSQQMLVTTKPQLATNVHKPEEHKMKKLSRSNPFDDSTIVSEEHSDDKDNSCEKLIKAAPLLKSKLTLDDHLELSSEPLESCRMIVLSKFEKIRKKDKGISTLITQYIEMACNYLSQPKNNEDSVEENRLTVLQAGYACIYYFFYENKVHNHLVDHIEAVCNDIMLKERDPEAPCLYFEFNHSRFNNTFLALGLNWLNLSDLKSHYKSLYISHILFERSVLENTITNLSQEIDIFKGIIDSNKVLFAKLESEIEELRGQINQVKADKLRVVNKQLRNKIAELEAVKLSHEKTIDTLNRALNSQKALINGRDHLDHHRARQAFFSNPFGEVVNDENNAGYEL